MRMAACVSAAASLVWLIHAPEIARGDSEAVEIVAAVPAPSTVQPAEVQLEPGLPLPEIDPVQALPGPQLTLQAALGFALTDNPALSALQKEIQAANGRYYQGSVKPNPEFEAEITDFMGTAETRYFVGAVSGFGVSQLIERGRKRCARMSVAEREGQVAEYEIERQRLDIMLAVSEAYYAALIAQEGLGLALEREALVQQVYDTVGLRVEGGKAARLDQSRAGIDLASARLAREEAQRQQQQAMARLISLWGGPASGFASVAGSLALPVETPQLEMLLGALPDTPELRRWTAEESLRRAKRDLAQAEGVPDITWSGGLERFESTDSFGFKLGVSFPLQLRRTTHGKVVEAQAYIDQVEDLRAADELALAQELTALHGELAAAHARAREIEENLLASASETFELTQIGYRYGKFGLLDVLDAQRTLVDVREQYFDALSAYQFAAVRIERLIAQPMANAEEQWDDPLAAVGTDATAPGQRIAEPTTITFKENHNA
jgi:cobalt-zinc-cadmium efflux system outer membrane protein